MFELSMPDLYFYMSSKHHGKCQFALKLIQLSTIANLFPLEVVQKCQCSQLCVLRENSNKMVTTHKIETVIPVMLAQFLKWPCENDYWLLIKQSKQHIFYCLLFVSTVSEKYVHKEPEMRFVFDYSKRYAIRIWTLHHKSNTLGVYTRYTIKK